MRSTAASDSMKYFEKGFPVEGNEYGLDNLFCSPHNIRVSAIYDPTYIRT